MMIRLLFLISFIVSISCTSYINLHNNARRAAGVYNNVRRSYTLESSSRRVAQWLCSTGQWKHSSTSRSGTEQGKRPYGIGENLGGHGNIDGAVNAFIAEKQYWRNVRCQSGKVCGHYTQIINSAVTEVGCAVVRGCAGSMKLGRTCCHYKSGGRMEVDVDFNKDECGEQYYDGDMCLYANEKVMRFATEQENGCEFEDKIYKHTDAAHNSYYLHYHPMETDDNSTETEDRWLVSRDYVSDIAQFWCDADSLMECEKGRWSKNIFAELGVSEEIDDGITIKQCPNGAEEQQEEATIHPILYILLGALAVIVIAGAIYCVVRSRNRGSIKHVEITDEEVEVNQTIEC